MGWFDLVFVAFYPRPSKHKDMICTNLQVGSTNVKDMELQKIDNIKKGDRKKQHRKQGTVWKQHICKERTPHPLVATSQHISTARLVFYPIEPWREEKGQNFSPVVAIEARSPWAVLGPHVPFTCIKRTTAICDLFWESQPGEALCTMAKKSSFKLREDLFKQSHVPRNLSYWGDPGLGRGSSFRFCFLF